MNTKPARNPDEPLAEFFDGHGLRWMAVPSSERRDEMHLVRFDPHYKESLARDRTCVVQVPYADVDRLCEFLREARDRRAEEERGLVEVRIPVEW